KRAEQQLRIAATAFESREGMFITDAEHRFVRANRAFLQMVGYTFDELLPLPPAVIHSERNPPEFLADLLHALDRDGAWRGEFWARRKDGEDFPTRLSVTAVRDEAGVATHYVLGIEDITERKLAEEEIRHLAYFDQLTGLPNRQLLADRLQQALAASCRHHQCGAVLFIDLDNFKTLNDTLGHEQGDVLLREVARRLSRCVRECDTVARQGGDEFVIMLEALGESLPDAANHAELVGEKIIASLNQPYLFPGYEHHSSASIGIAMFSGCDEVADELLKRADMAMYQAKSAGRNTLRFFDPEMQAVVSAHAALEAGLREALQQDHFVLHFQPQVDSACRLTGAEVLLRWHDPRYAQVPARIFITVAEETGLIIPIGEWVLSTVCAQFVAWQADPALAHLSIAVNISPRQFQQKDFVERLLATLEHSGADPRRLKLELTEGILVKDIDDVVAKMGALKAHGIGFSLDDFGTGYSSLSYLKRLPLDQLKIDQGFVRDILADADDAAIAGMVVALGENFGLTVIAEGVETEAQLFKLAELGCNHYQGYLFSRPLPQADFEAYARSQTRR
ncbi:putative bifunctional diguanylate cyclase/phosphodiesterase, partial [Propionivibrio sp.]|uniref:putative bifunctional diguanylate cyclase/phosphodiesterase n=1 Tax=Propionivibrio sp. TaxID=2212460 RepID=UPI00272E2ED0